MPDKHGKFIIDIVPLTKIPLTRNQSFSYLHDTKLSVGTLVTVPLFRRKVEGIVLTSRSDFRRLGNIELKKVEKVVEESFLTEKQLELAQFISEYYISPLGVVMKGFVPKRAKARNLERGVCNIERKRIILTKEQTLAVNKISENYLPVGETGKLKAKKYLLFGPSGSGKTEVYIHSILKLKEKNKNLQFLILVPEQTLTPQAMERYGEYFKSEEIVMLSSNISRGQFYENWQRIKSGEAKIIIATRTGVMAPFANLGLIVIDEEQDMSYKQWDMNPRYDARTVAEKLAEFYKCPMILGSATPRIESNYEIIENTLDLINLPLLSLPKAKIIPSNIMLIDMKKERWQKNYSCISRKLKSEIGYALKNKLQTILLINRQGMSSFSVCESCKTVLKCPKCDRAVVYDEKGHYRCVHCAYKTSITPQCSKCRGIIFKNIGLGTQKVEREINDIFPGASVARIDSQKIRGRDYQKKIYLEFAQKKIDILIGTQMISKGWDFPNLALVGIVDADNLLSSPDYHSSEYAYDMIVQVSGRVSRPGARYPGQVIIQSYNPENKILKMAAEKDYKKFYDEEIKNRKLLGLPPFVRIVKLIFQDYDHKKVDKIADSVYNLLECDKRNIKISEPHYGWLPKIRARFRKQIILKIGSKFIPNQTLKILKSLPAGWIIDIDPVSTL